MKVTFFSCGPVANESELKALAHLKSRLQAESGGDRWILLGNLAFSVTHQLQSDEIDIVVIGPPGVRVLEVKHWAPQWVDTNEHLVEQEADRVTNKAREDRHNATEGLPGVAACGRCHPAAALVHDSKLTVNDPTPAARHRPRLYDSGRPSSGIWFRT